MSSDTPNLPTGDSPDATAPEFAETGTTPVPAAGRREAVREKAQQVHVKQSRARLARRAALVVSAVAAVAVIGVVVTWTVGVAAGRPQLAPTGVQKDGFVVSSITSAPLAGSPDDASSDAATPEGDAVAPDPTPTASAPVEISVYVDFLSPSAREWQLANESQLASWVADGAATLTYHPVAMLTAKSNGTKYSLRAASAAACVATHAPEKLFGFNSDLLKRQPAVDSDGFSDEVLADIALANGTDNPKELRECIETEAFASWVKSATERAVAGIEGTNGVSLTGNSLIVVNGQAYMGEMTDPAEFAQFVLTSASGKALKAQNATPTPTPTVSVSP